MKTNFLLFTLAGTLLSANVNAQTEQPKDSVSYETLDEVLIQAVRANKKTPMAFSNLSKEEIAKKNLGQDIPVLMNFMPSVVTTTDAGNGVGYTGIRVRGSDATRVNVTLNGIPYNDSESHGSFWVNMPDFASSLENLQLQRGVGTSTNGSGAFGASLNLLTDAFSEKSSGEISNSFGSYNTRKHTVKFSTGLMNNAFEISGRLSNINSDGYIDRAKSDLKSYFLQGAFIDGRTLIKALAFGGTQKTYQAWNGLEDKDKLENDRTYNTSGEYIDAEGNIRFYDNENDNYDQNHYQLHWNQRWNTHWNTNFALHLTTGIGYFENYKVGETLSEYGLQNPIVNNQEIEEADVIRQKFLKNNFYGFTFSSNYKKGNLDFIFGGAANKYEGDHYGKILWVDAPVKYSYEQQYYFDQATKTDANIFAKATYTLKDKWILFGDLQLRNVHYKANGEETGFVDDTFNFFNPKAGLTYLINESQQTYFSFARANREPNRTDYKSGVPKPERLNDFELGWKLSNEKLQVNINGYYMRYKNQLVLTGALNDVGAPIRENSGDSYRLGIEIDGAWAITNKFIWAPSITLSSNKNIDFKAHIDGEVQNLGNTNIAFSPNLVASNAFTYLVKEDFSISLLTKFVGEQYMGNTDSEYSKLDSYFTNDLVLNYSLKTKKWFSSIDFNLMINNIFNVKYISNGYYYTYDDNWSNPNTTKTIEGAGYYPQAIFNILGGISLKF